jgi:UBX domain-containing protein 1
MEDVSAEESAPPAASSASTNVAPSVAPASTNTGPRTLTGKPAPEAPAGWGKKAATSSSARKAGGGFSASGGGGRGIATLRDLRGEAAPAGHGHDDDDDAKDGDKAKKPASFYTGGEKSGLSVLNPDRKKGGSPDVVNKILQKAQETAQKRAQGGESSSSKGAAASSSTFSFGGQGRTINDDGPKAQETLEETPSESPSPPDFQLPDLPPGALSAEFLRALRQAPRGTIPGFEAGEEQEDANDEVAIRHVVFWQDGFTLAGGPLCRYDDPEHSETLELLNNGRAPLRLLNIRFGQKVDLQVENKKTEKYKPPTPPPMKPFGGQGNRLGTQVPAMAGAPSTTAASATVAVSAAPATNTPDPSSLTFQVDSSQPTTQIQIRLSDGQRMVAKFNHTHTVADIRQYINAAHAGMNAQPYTLQSSFPPKPLTDEAMSIKEAGLINSVVIQKRD